jgi:putative ABC transport system permease protein
MSALAASGAPGVGTLLREISLREWRHHPWRTATAWFSILLGVALAFAVHLVNESALGEFSAAVRQVNAQPDFELRGPRAGFDEALYGRVATHPSVAAASPVLEIDSYAASTDNARIPVRVLGIDALQVVGLAPQLLPQPGEGAPRLAWFETDAVFMNDAARARLGTDAVAPPATLKLQSGQRWLPFRVQGRVAADGPPLVVMDLAGAQLAFERLGLLTRIDVRLVPGADAAAVLRELALPAGVRAATGDEQAARVSNVSRAYRVNLTVLALVALFTGAFLVFSILALSVAQRQGQLALMGVIGLSARERLTWILAEATLLGLLGSLAGLVVGTSLAWLGLVVLAGDLGGAYFPGVQPSLRFSAWAAVAYGGLGVLAAVVGGWLPARAAAAIAPAQALKGMGTVMASGAASASRAWRLGMAGFGPVCLVLGVVLAFAPPIAGLPLAAYAAVALLLVGGIACVPAGVRLLLGAWPEPRHPLALLALQRARHQRHSAAVTVAGVVASLSLAVALTVMVASFRGSILEWLDTILPADLYARTATSAGASETAFIDPRLIEATAQLPGVSRVEAVRLTQANFDPSRPAVALVARPLPRPDSALPFVGSLLPASGKPAGHDTVYVSEAMVNLYGARPGQTFELPLPTGAGAPVWVRGVWRDYARQHGAIVMEREDFVRLTGDRRVNDLAIALDAGTDPTRVQAQIRQAAERMYTDGGPVPIEFATPGEIRALSMRIFDRSFAVTYWLQAVAIGIGLFGIAASFSAQVLARRKEFGLLSHLGLTRREILTVVALEGAAWTAVGALLGLLLGLAVSVVLVHVVNPQSFNWTMQLRVPADRLALLGLAVLLCGTVTAWWAGRAAARRDLALSVKEDW